MSTDSSTTRRGVRRRLSSFVAAVVAAAGAFFVVMPAGLAAADTNQCGYGSSDGNSRTCVSVGSTSVSTSATVVSSARVLQSCLHRDGVRITCTPYTYVPAGGGIGNTWVPGGPVPSGNYCAVTWRLNTDGTTTEIDSECVGVTIVG
jgi:hypothetical protein